MRRHVVLLAAVLLVSGSAAVLTGCGSPAATERPVAAPTNTAAPTQEATATASGVADSTSTPAPVPTDDDALEFLAPADTFGSSGKQEPIAGVDQDSPQKGSAGSADPVQGNTYTWQDGDRTLTAYLQTDLVVERGSGGTPRDVVAADEGGTNVVRSADGQSESDTLPVFRSESGGLMTLPGGVLLVLDAEWSTAEVNAFFSGNGIKQDRASELSYADNGFFIETEPGFPSLDLANTLAALDGVEISSPNWGREAVAK